MTSLLVVLLVYVVFGPILHILITVYQDYVCLQHFVAIDVFLKSFIIISTYRRRHVTSETGFKQDSPKPNSDSDSLTKCTFY